MSKISIQLCRLHEIKTGEIIRYRGYFFEKVGSYLIGQSNEKTKALDCINLSIHNAKHYALIINPQSHYTKFSQCAVGDK